MAHRGTSMASRSVLLRGSAHPREMASEFRYADSSGETARLNPESQLCIILFHGTVGKEEL